MTGRGTAKKAVRGIDELFDDMDFEEILPPASAQIAALKGAPRSPNPAAVASKSECSTSLRLSSCQQNRERAQAQHCWLSWCKLAPGAGNA